MCKSLTTVSMPRVRDVGASAFERCEALTTVSMDEVENVAGGAFVNCGALTTVEYCGTAAVPQSPSEFDVTCDGAVVFKTLFRSGIGTTCAHVGSDGALSIPEGETAIDGLIDRFEDCTEQRCRYDSLRGCAALRSLTLPASLETIGELGLDGCSNLLTVTFTKPSVLRSIGGSAFGSTALTSITIPPIVETFGEFGSLSCTTYRCMTYSGMSRHVFHGCDALTTVEYCGAAAVVGHFSPPFYRPKRPTGST